MHQVQDQGGGQQHGGHQPGAALAPQHAPGQHHQADAGQGHQGPGRLGHAQGQVLADQVEVAGGRPADRHQQVEQPGQEDGPGGQPPHPAHPDPAGGHSGRRGPRGAPGPRGHHGRVQVGRLLVALHHRVPGGDALQRGRGGQVDVGQQEADVEIGPGLQLDVAGLPVVEEHRGHPEPSRVLAHQLGGAARAGEEALAEMDELGPQPTPGDQAGGPARHQCPGLVEGFGPADQQAAGQRCLAGVGRRPSGPGRREGFPAVGLPDPSGDHGHQHRHDQLQDHHHGQGEGQPAGPGGGVGPHQHPAGSRRLPDQVVHAVVDDGEPDDQRHHHGQERWHPDEPAEAPVEGAGADEAPRGRGVLQPVDAAQPGAVPVAAVGIPRAPSGGRPGRTSTRRSPAGGGQPEVDRGGDLGAHPVELGDGAGVGGHARVPPAGQHDQTAVRSAGEALDGLGQVAVGHQGVADPLGGRAVAPGEEVAADDHRARPLPVVEGEGHVGGQRPRRRAGLGRQEEVADHHHPLSQPHRDLGGRRLLGDGVVEIGLGYRLPPVGDGWRHGPPMVPRRGRAGRR